MTVDKSAGGDTASQGPTDRSEWTEFDRPSTAVVVAVAEATGRDSTELQVLNESIDGDALDALLTDSPKQVEVSFEYAGATVRLSSDGTLVVETFE